MSWTSRPCVKCGGDCRFVHVKPFGGEGSVYGVAWVCDDCEQESLDLCPLAPMVPRAGGCLSCGSEAPSGICAACGTNLTDVKKLVRASQKKRESLAAAVNRLANAGLMRLAINLIVLQILARPTDAAPWMEKGSLLLSIDFPLAALGAVNIALDHATATERPTMLHLRADILCAIDRALEALRDIDEALRDGDDAVERNYTRGRALGLVGGRLHDAIEAMRTVLRLRPDYQSAKRAIGILQGEIERMEGEEE